MSESKNFAQSFLLKEGSGSRFSKEDMTDEEIRLAGLKSVAVKAVAGAMIAGAVGGGIIAIENAQHNSRERAGDVNIMPEIPEILDTDRGGNIITDQDVYGEAVHNNDVYIPVQQAGELPEDISVSVKVG